MTRLPAGSSHRALSLVLAGEQPLDECWPWTGPKNAEGYGLFHFAKVQHKAHRFVYGLLVEPLADDETLDHACHTAALREGLCSGGVCAHRLCVNPRHLEPVGNVANVMRGDSFAVANAVKTTCVHGHLLDGIRQRRGVASRYCLTCHREQVARARAARRGHSVAVHAPEEVAA